MRELHVVALSEDGTSVLLAVRRDAKTGTFRVALNGKLSAAVRGDLAREGESAPRDSTITPKEIQARLRAGESAAEIAADAGVAVARVERFSGPVFSERERMIGEVRGAVLVRGRKGPSALPLGEAVDEQLAVLARGGSVSWGARREEDGHWFVEVAYVSRGRDKHGRWLWDPVKKVAKAVDPASAALGHLERAPVKPHKNRPPLVVSEFAPRRDGGPLKPKASTPVVAAAARVRKPVPVVKAPAAKKPGAAKRPAAAAPAAKPTARHAAAKAPAAKAVPRSITRRVTVAPAPAPGAAPGKALPTKAALLRRAAEKQAAAAAPVEAVAAKRPAKAAARKAPAAPVVAAPPVKAAVVVKAVAKKTAITKAPVAKAPAKKAPAKQAPVNRAPVKAAVKEAAAKVVRAPAAVRAPVTPVPVEVPKAPRKPAATATPAAIAKPAKAPVPKAPAKVTATPPAPAPPTPVPSPVKPEVTAPLTKPAATEALEDKGVLPPEPVLTAVPTPPVEPPLPAPQPPAPLLRVVPPHVEEPAEAGAEAPAEKPAEQPAPEPRKPAAKGRASVPAWADVLLGTTASRAPEPTPHDEDGKD